MTNPTEANPQNPPLVLWHGSRAWEGKPEVRPSRKGRSEHGPGIYLTTSYQTATGYAKGGGVVQRVDVSSDLGWLEGSAVPLADMKAFVEARRGLRKKRELLADLDWSAQRTKNAGEGMLWASSLVTLFVNHEAITGDHGPALAAFLVEHGIDASLANERSGEDWVVLFNPAKVVRVQRAPATSVPVSEWDLPRVPRQR